MQKKLFLSYVIIILVAIGISATAFWSRGYNYIYGQSEDYHLMQAKMLADDYTNYSGSDKEFTKEFGEKYNLRITLIGRDGEVKSDSNTNAKLENHATREEVVKALKGKSISLHRYSKTMGKDYAYSAVPVKKDLFDGVIRTSVPLSEMSTLDKNLVNSIYYSLILCMIVAVIIAIICTRILSRPINEVTKAAEEIANGDYGIKIYTREKDQIGRLAKAFNIMTTNLKVSVTKLTVRNVELESMLSSMTSGVVAVDNVNSILFYNKAFLKMTGVKTKDLSNKSFYNTVRNAVIFEVIDEVRETKTTKKKEGMFGDDSNQMIRVTATPLLGEEKDLGVLLIIEDITQIKKLENMRSDFVSNVTHELKTPLTSIRGFIDTLKNGAIKDEKTTEKFLDIIDIEAERLYVLIQDILLLSEIESRKDYDVKACDINNVIEEVVLLLTPKVDENVKIIYNKNENIKPLPCNHDRMKQLLINLLDNAIKYTEEGSIIVKCNSYDNYLEISVKDTGIGIEEKHLQRIFERFYRVDKGRSRKQGGTGLGLSIVKHITELYGGTIEVDSKVSVGTEFIIHFPY